MFKISKEEFEWGGQKRSLETGKLAREADGSVVAACGETVVLATVVGALQPKEGIDFFPLTVNYQERYYAAGKIPGGYFKRERAPTERETLISRLIDRPIRPLFAEGYKNETQVVCQVLSHDLENDRDSVAMIAASAALTISGVPFQGPIGAARVAYIDGAYVLNPPIEDMPKSKLELVVAGTADAVLMVESEAQDLDEQTMLGAVMFGHREMQHAINAIIKLAEKAAKEPRPVPHSDTGLKIEEIEKIAGLNLTAAFQIPVKFERRDRIAEIKKKTAKWFVGEGDGKMSAKEFGSLFHDLEAKVMRNAVLDTEKPMAAHALVTVRPIVAEVGILPRPHGSALFTRGETQALVVSTLGTGQDEQVIDALEGEYRQNFMLHYNFPPYATGEAGRMGSPGRREIGHGKLAWRAIRPMLPGKDKFPYTIRIVSEITESNGSSSMASVCGGSLSLMDAGVPLERPVGGIAMGLIKEGERFAVLTDILGDEDHLGDMDFKVAGTERGITALQMDIKITSINEEIMRVALGQAKDGRLHILGEMAKGLGGARESVSQNAPRITQFTIPKDKIREVIGTGGKVIREITETTGTKIDIEDDGTIKVAAVDAKQGQAAIDWIKGIVAEPEVGVIYTGKVVKTVEFGAFVNFLGARDGLVHISDLAPRRVGKVTDGVKGEDH